MSHSELPIADRFPICRVPVVLSVVAVAHESPSTNRIQVSFRLRITACPPTLENLLTLEQREPLGVENRRSGTPTLRNRTCWRQVGSVQLGWPLLEGRVVRWFKSNTAKGAQKSLLPPSFASAAGQRGCRGARPGKEEQRQMRLRAGRSGREIWQQTAQRPLKTG